MIPRPVKPESSTAASFANFVKIEPYIAAILNEFPRTVVLKPKELKASSLLVYLRTAMHTFLHEDCHWPANFTKERLASAFEAGLKLTFDRGENTVTATCVNIESSSRIAGASVQIAGAVSGEDREVLFALALLKDREIIRDPITITNLSQPLCEELTQAFPNITISSDPSTPSITTMF